MNRNPQTYATCSYSEAQRKTDETSLKRRRDAWKKQVFRRRGTGSKIVADHLLNALFGDQRETVDRDLTDWQRLKAAFRFAARICKQDPSQRTTSAVLIALTSTNPDEALADVYQTSLAERANRQAAAVDVRAMLPQLRQFLRLLNRSHRFRIPPLEIAEPNSHREKLGESIVAYTDSKRIFLPSKIATTNSRVLNERFAVYLAIHEWTHSLFRSFNYSSKTRRGKMARVAFESLARKTKTVVKSQKFEESLLDLPLDISSIESKLIEEYLLNGTAALFAKIPWPNIAHRVFNILEDSRMEREIQHHWPGLGLIHENHERLASGLYVAAEANDSIQNLINAIGAYATGRRFPSIVAEDQHAVLSQCMALIDQFNRLGRRRDVYHTLFCVAAIFDVLMPSLESSEAETDEAEVSATPPLTMLEIDAAKLQKHLLESSDERRHFSLPLDDGEREGTDEGYLVDELVDEGQSYVLYPDITQVIVEQYEPLAPDRLPVLAPLALPFPTLATTPHHRLGARRFNPDGRFMANERLAPYVASVRAGNEDYPLLYDRHEQRTSLQVTILCDLSLSMEASLKSLGDESLLQRAIQLTKFLTSNFRNQGVSVEIYGAHDAGRRPVHLRPLQTQIDDDIEKLRAVGFAGFRLGAVLRGLHRHRLESPKPPGKHVVLALTDATGLYLLNGGDQTVERVQELCPTCPARIGCNYERASAAGAERSLWYTRIGYATDDFTWSDIADALESTDTRLFHLFAIDENLASRAAIFDHHLGNQWSDATTAEGILQGVLRLAEVATK